MSSRLDRVLYSAAAGSLVLAVASLLWASSSNRQVAGYEVGERFELGSDLDLSAASATLVLWLDSQCGACTDNMPLYRRLTTGPRQVRVVAMGRESAASLEDYLGRHGVIPDQILSGGDRVLDFTGTPTLLLVGRDTIIRAVWYGRVDPHEEQEVVKGLNPSRGAYQAR